MSVDPDAQATEQSLRAEIARLNKVVEALMNRVEHSSTKYGSDYDQFQTTIMLENLVRARTQELEAALRENEKVNRQLQEAEEKFHRVLDQSLVGIAMIIDDRFHYVNPKFAEIFAYDVDQLLSRAVMELIAAVDQTAVKKIMRSALNREFSQISFSANALRRDGETIVVEVSGSAAIEIGGKQALITVLADITERVRAEQRVQALNQQLQYQSVHDGLTGLYNRLFLNENLERELASASRQGYVVSLVMSDLDHFKKINDTFGHQAGDAVLQAFASIFKRYARVSDLDCRYGGEEFMLVLPNTVKDIARERAELIRAALEAQPIATAAGEIALTASFGVASYPFDGASGAELIEAADRALYIAKETGRNRVCCG